MRYLPIPVFLMVALLGTDIQAAQQPQCFAYTRLDVGEAETSTTLVDINRKMEMVGDSSGAFLLDADGDVIPIAVPGSWFTSAVGINDAGEITGSYSKPQEPIRGYFRTRRGRFITLDVPGSNLTEASGINDLGHVVGDYRDAVTGVYHGFLWDGEGFSTIDVPFPGVTSAAAHGINSVGEIVGTYDDASGRHGFLLSGGVFSSVDVPGATSTSLHDINDRGHIVGGYAVSDTMSYSFLLANGTFTSIEVPFDDAVFTQVLGINDRSEVVGRYFDGSLSHGFIGIPQRRCEPAQ